MWIGHSSSVPIILYTLLPIGWILSLSLKTGATINDRNYFPRHCQLGELQATS